MKKDVIKQHGAAVRSASDTEAEARIRISIKKSLDFLEKKRERQILKKLERVTIHHSK